MAEFIDLKPNKPTHVQARYHVPISFEENFRAAPVLPKSDRVLKDDIPLPPLPKEFSWANAEDIRTKRMENKISLEDAKKLVPQIRNQKNCGSCWAFATATVMAQRQAFLHMKPVEELSTTELISCIPGTGCAGGQLLEAGHYLEQKGVSTEECNPYAWCCGKTNAEEINVPACRELKSCNTRVRAKPNSTSGLDDIESIKHDLFKHGMVTAGFLVFEDFTRPAKSGGWNPKTDIYVHDPDNFQRQGGHAVVIVGWGGTDVPYWVVQNSWGPTWGDSGYFRMAMTDKKTGRNTQCGLDIPISMQGGRFGGVVSWLPDVTKAASLLYQVTDTEPDTYSSRQVPKPVLSRGTKMVLIVSAVILCVAIAIKLKKKSGGGGIKTY